MAHKHIDLEKVKSDRDKTSGRIKELYEELAKTKHNKRTEHHIGLIGAKIAKLKEKIERRAKGKKEGDGYVIKRTGDATVALVGFPSVGKSSLLNKITNANSPVASYDFTTLRLIPGLINYNSAQIQLFDLPGILEGASEGRGRGKEVFSCLRNVDLIIIIIDAKKPEQYDVIKNELYESNIRLNEKRPAITLMKKDRGGISVRAHNKLKHISAEEIRYVLNEFKILNADVILKEDVTVERFIDFVESNKAYIPSIIVVNKIDIASESEIKNINEKLKPDIFVSAEKSINLENLKKTIFNKLELIRIYLKPLNQKSDMEKPLIMHKDSTIKDVCLKLHKDFAEKLKFARVWGKSAKFEGQTFLSLEHVLEDGDIIEFHLK